MKKSIIKRAAYVAHVFNDHLFDTKVYQELTLSEANKKARETIMEVKDLLIKYPLAFSYDENNYIKSFLQSTPLRFPQFYILFKIHKEPMTTRPIASVSGSYLHGLGKWVDHQLKPTLQRIHSYISSTKQFLSFLPPNVQRGSQLFTADAKAMYTNIDT